LAQGKIVAWFDGRMELGPRALGNRSLLGDPRRAEVREVLNVKVKHRELFRPFCPSVLSEKAPSWFDLGERAWSATRYMLAAVKVLPHQKHRIPAVVHVDDTCRVQVVERRTSPKYHRLIQEFERRTEVPVVLNTSFNDSEPIVCTPDDAIETFSKTRIDNMALGDFMVSRPESTQA
jgi:carbamoyltransferase